jgi:hypothetical protein
VEAVERVFEGAGEEGSVGGEVEDGEGPEEEGGVHEGGGVDVTVQGKGEEEAGAGGEQEMEGGRVPEEKEADAHALG